jgi:hypothetical protein
MLQTVYDVFHREAAWPTAQYVDKTLDREGLSLAALFGSLPAGLIQPDASWGGYVLRDEEELRLTPEGLRACEGGECELRVLAKVLGYLAHREEEFAPVSPRAVERVEVTSREIAEALSLSPTDLARTYQLLRWEPTHVYNSLSGGDAEWQLILTSEVRRFRGVSTAADYFTKKPPPLVGPRDVANPLVAAEPEETVLRPLPKHLPSRVSAALRHPVIATVVGGLIVAALVVWLGLR